MTRRERKRRALAALRRLADADPVGYADLVDAGDLRDDMVTLVELTGGER